MKASEIITKARYTLSDIDKSRWSDDRLLSLLNDALLDVALSTRLYNSKGLLKLQAGISVYDVSPFAVKLERVEHRGVPLAKVSFEEMDDRFGERWQSEEDENPSHIVYDLKRAGEFRIYPIPKQGANDLVKSNSNYGIVTALNYAEAELKITEGYGGVNSPNISMYLKLYYISSPKEITSVDDEMGAVIDRTMLSSLAHYVSGAALRDNMDSQNRQVGNEELSFYEGKKRMLANQKMKGSIKRIRVTDYRGME